MKYGSYFGQKEVEEGKNVCVISDADAKRLFGTDDVVGMTLDITCYDLTKTFRICGVTTQKENLRWNAGDHKCALYGHGRLYRKQRRILSDHSSGG